MIRSGSLKSYVWSIDPVMRRSLVFLILLAIAGCARMPERIREHVSPFDGAQEISLEPAFVCRDESVEPCFIRLGLYRRSTMSPDGVILLAVVNGSNPIEEGESLHFRIDDSFFSFVSIDRKTQYGIGKGPHTAGTLSSCPSASCSVKRYLVDKKFLEKLISSDDVMVSIDLARGSVQGRLLGDNPVLALPAFKDFFVRAFGPVR